VPASQGTKGWVRGLGAARSAALNAGGNGDGVKRALRFDCPRAADVLLLQHPHDAAHLLFSGEFKTLFEFGRQIKVDAGYGARGEDSGAVAGNVINGGFVPRLNERVLKRLGGRDAGLIVKDEHALQQMHGAA